MALQFVIFAPPLGQDLYVRQLRVERPGAVLNRRLLVVDFVLHMLQRYLKDSRNLYYIFERLATFYAILNVLT